MQRTTCTAVQGSIGSSRGMKSKGSWEMGRGEDSGVGDVGSKLGLAESSSGKGPSLKAIGHSRAGARLEKDGNQGHRTVAG